MYAGGLQYANQIQCEIDWWIFAGRIAGGLSRNQQVDVFQRVSPALLPRGAKKQRVNSSLLREMWRTASSLELLPVSTRTELGDKLAKERSFGASELWCLSRLGARQLFYGPVNQVLPPGTVTRWIEALLNVNAAGEALASMARRTGDATRDVGPALFEKVRARLDSEKLAAILEGQEARDERSMGRIFGEALPSGLVLSAQ